MEISAPAGNLQTSIIALKNGADSVYFGMKFFSARAGADNFSIDDFRRLRKYALDNSKKIYVTINTILPDELLPSLFSLLKMLDFYGVDGVIVQDWGAVNIIKKYFPHLSLHASTQMAIQNASGVNVLKKLGFKRAVLARELGIDEIESIKKSVDDIELKVFVHGALCYCVSGLCFASRFLVGCGSANRGSCKQVCRMNFKRDGKAPEPIFSLKDLASDRQIIKRLENIGIESIKIEGRLKGASYVKWASCYYRAILDNEGAEREDECLKRLKACFSRDTTPGFLAGDEDIYLDGFQGHRGLKIGVCDKDGNFVLNTSMLPHDGIMLLRKDSKDFYKKDMAIYAQKGDKIQIKFGKYIPKFGDELYKIKDSRDNIESFDENNFSLFRRPVDIKIKISEDNIYLSSQFCKMNVNKSHYIKLEQSRSPQDINTLLKKAFSRQSNFFTLGNIDIENSVGNPFLPSSVLKKIANDFYKALDLAADEYFKKPYVGVDMDNLLEKYNKKDFCEQGDITYSPVVFDSKAPGGDIFEKSVVKINNISQLDNIISSDGIIDKKIKGVVLGEYFNIANKEALEFFLKLLKDRLLGVFVSPECDENDSKELKTHCIVSKNPESTLPVFIHRRADKKGCVETYMKDVNLCK